MSDIDTSRPQSCGCGEAAYADCACNPKPLPWGSGQATFPPGVHEACARHLLQTLATQDLLAMAPGVETAPANPEDPAHD